MASKAPKAENDYLPASLREGYVLVELPTTSMQFALDEYERMRLARNAGGWFDGVDNYGNRKMFPWAKVEGVTACSPQTLADMLADENERNEAQNAQNIIHGGG